MKEKGGATRKWTNPKMITIMPFMDAIVDPQNHFFIWDIHPNMDYHIQLYVTPSLLFCFYLIFVCC